MNTDNNSRPHIRTSAPNESRRLTDIGGKSGHHAVIVGQTRGAGYLGDMQGFALPFVLFMIVVFVSVMRIWIGGEFPTALIVIGGVSAVGNLGLRCFPKLSLRPQRCRRRLYRCRQSQARIDIPTHNRIDAGHRMVQLAH